MHKLIGVGLIILATKGFAQIDRYQFPKEIVNSKTENHVNIPGTRLFIIPPKKFKVSATYPPAIYDENGVNAFIQVNDLIGKNFYNNKHNNELLNSGFNILYSGDFKINSYSGKLNFYKADSDQLSYDIIFGDSTFISTITAVFPANDSSIANQIKNSLLTVYYDESYNINPFATAVFKIDDSKSIFKFADVSGFTYVYTLKGEKNIDYDNDPYSTITEFPAEGVTSKQFADEWLASLTSRVLTNIKIKQESNKTINGFQAFEREAYAKQNNKAVLFYQVSMQINNQNILFMCVAYNNYETYLEEFKKLINTIEQK